MKTLRNLALAMSILLVISNSSSAYAKESEDLQNQLNFAEDRLNTGRYCTDNQSKNAVLWDGYIADIQKSADENPGNASIASRLAEYKEQRQIITRMLNECIAIVASAGAQVSDLRIRLAAALAAETAAAAEEVKKKVFSENESKEAVTTATTEVAATTQRIQTDNYNINDANTKIEVLNNSLSTLQKDSTTFNQVQASIAALESIKRDSEARLKLNLELQAQQKVLLDELIAIQTNAVKVNSRSASELLTSSKEAKENLDKQENVLEKQVGDIEDQVKKIDELLARLSKDSPDYARLVETRSLLTSSIEEVKAEQLKVIEQTKQNDELAEKAREATLATRLESVILGKLVSEEEKSVVPVLKAKRLNAKFSAVTTKPIDAQEDQLENLIVNQGEMEGVKLILRAGKSVIRVNKVSINEDGSMSFSIPRKAKSGTYTMTLDLPDTDDDLKLKVKISN